MLNNEISQEKPTKKINGKESTKNKIEVEDLKKFVHSFDPYAPMTKKDKKYLNSLNIFSLEDPFKVTNQLILLLEEIIEKDQEK